MIEEPHELHAIAEVIERGEDGYHVPAEMLVEPERDTPVNKSIYQQIRGMAVGERLKLALKGNREARTLLLRDSNKMIQYFVLKNPRISEEEIIQLARNRNVESDMLRAIGDHRMWPKNYQVRVGLVTNPKTPLAVAMPMVKHLTEKDLRFIAKSKNVSAAVVATARRILVQKGKM